MTAIAGDAMGVGPYRYFLCWSQAAHAGTGFLNVTGLDHLVRTPGTPMLATFYP